MKCSILHNDPNDQATRGHIAECYEAFEVYADPNGLTSEAEYNEMTRQERLRYIEAGIDGTE